MQDIISTLKNALQQAEAGLEVAVGRLAKDGTERGDFKPSEVLALACVREALATPVTCLHQIQEPAAAEQAAWHAGLDEGRAQATGSVSNATSQPAPAAVTATASPTFMTADQGRDWAWNIVREYVGTEGWTVMDSVNFHGFFLYGWNYRGQYELQRTAAVAAVKQELTAAPVAAGKREDMQDMVSKALTTAWQLGQTFWRQADSVRHTQHVKSEQTERDFEALIESTRAALAATPAAAPGKLGDDMQMRCRKCGEQVKIEFNSARIVTHNPHTGKPRDARDVESDPEGKLIVAPGPLFAAAAPVVLPEPDAEIAVLMNRSACQKYPNDINLRIAHNEGWNAARALLATATGLPAQAVPVANCYSNDEGDTWSDCPDDCDFVDGRALGEEFELQASIRAWKEVFRVTKVPDETSDDYEVEPVSIRTTAAPQAQADARDAGRYRDLRSLLYGQDVVIDEATLIFKVTGQCPTIEEFDAGVDAAIASAKGE